MSVSLLVPSSRLRVLAVLGVLALPAPAGAAGFSQPVVISGSDDARAPQVAIAPNGRTAVLYARDVRRAGRWRTEYRAAIGPSPHQLGQPATVEAGARADDGIARPTLVARADGGFAACFPDETSTKTAVIGCSVAPADGGFGPLRVLARGPRGDNASVRVAAGPSGSLVALISRLPGEGDGRVAEESLTLLELEADGTVGPEASIATAETAASDFTAPIAVRADGTVVIAASTVVAGRRVPAVRQRLPGAAQFGPPVPISSEENVLGPRLSADGLTARFQTADPKNPERSVTRVVQGQPDGSWGPTLALPSVMGRRADWADLVPGSAGVPLAITSRTKTEPGDSDCYNQIWGVVHAGSVTPLGSLPSAATRLSVPGQIALWPQGAATATGTQIAAWENAVSYQGYTRLEVRVRPAGAPAFLRSQVLPYLNLGGSVGLAAGGSEAALAWTAGGTGFRSQVVLSALQQAAPYANRARLPREPEAACDE